MSPNLYACKSICTLLLKVLKLHKSDKTDRSWQIVKLIGQMHCPYNDIWDYETYSLFYQLTLKKNGYTLLGGLHFQTTTLSNNSSQ